MDGGNAFLGPQAFIELSNTIIAENFGTERVRVLSPQKYMHIYSFISVCTQSSAISLCLYESGTHPEIAAVADHAHLTNVSFCRNQFMPTGAAAHAWGQGALHSECVGNATHLVDVQFFGNRGILGDEDIRAYV